MDRETQKNRKWERYACLLPCRIIPASDPDLIIPARIINIGRGGILFESDFDFEAGHRVTIVGEASSGGDHINIQNEIHGTVRWGQLDPNSLMGLFYVGVEFDELQPLKQAALRLG